METEWTLLAKNLQFSSAWDMCALRRIHYRQALKEPPSDVLRDPSGPMTKRRERTENTRGEPLSA